MFTSQKHWQSFRVVFRHLVRWSIIHIPFSTVLVCSNFVMKISGSLPAKHSIMLII